MKYSINLVTKLLKDEEQSRRNHLRRITYSLLTFGILFLSLFYAGLEISTMHTKIVYEQKKLEAIEEEYKKYRETSMIIDKLDIELLNQLMTDRVYWTKKLAATALYLPEDYWIERINGGERYEVKGFGLVVPEQKQLITLDTYLNLMEADTTFNDVFPDPRLDAVIRSDEEETEQVHFELSAEKGKRY